MGITFKYDELGNEYMIDGDCNGGYMIAKNRVYYDGVWDKKKVAISIVESMINNVNNVNNLAKVSDYELLQELIKRHKPFLLDNKGIHGVHISEIEHVDVISHKGDGKWLETGITYQGSGWVFYIAED